MALDLVHDVQAAYRLLVRAATFPGTVVALQPIARKMDPDSGVPSVVFLLGLIVSDGEVSFSVAGDRKAGVALSEATGAPWNRTDEGVPFNFVVGSATPTSNTLAVTPTGTSEDPEVFTGTGRAARGTLRARNSRGTLSPGRSGRILGRRATSKERRVPPRRRPLSL